LNHTDFFEMDAGGYGRIFKIKMFFNL